MPFPGYDDNVGGMGQVKGLLNGLLAVRIDQQALGVTMLHALADVRNDLLRVFTAGIIGSHDDDVCQPFRQSPPFSDVLVASRSATATKHHNQTTV